MLHDQIALAYIGVRGDLDEWTAFAAGLHGMQPTLGDGCLLLRMDEKAWRIRVDREGTPGLAFVGFQWDTETGFETMLMRARAGGYHIHEDTGLAACRQVGRLATISGPGNINYEFCVGHAATHEPFVSPTGARFVAGPLGMGHIGIRVRDLSEADRWLQDVMGLRASDWASGGHFFRGGSRHHLIVTVQATASSGEGLHHLFVEVEELPMLGRAWDKVEAGVAPVFMTLGQHSNDPTMSYYCLGPSGLCMEYGWHSLLVDDASWKPREWTAPSLWGHHRITSPSTI